MGRFGQATLERGGEDDHYEAASFEDAMEHHFPGSFEAQDWLDTTYVVLENRHFNAENSLACISVCRDFLASGLVKQVNDKWGAAVNGSSIAGFLALGKTGLRGTLSSNAPRGFDRDRYVFIAMPHLAISASGAVGSPEGLLGRFHKELEKGEVSLIDDPLDSEYDVAKKKLLQKHNFGPVPSLIKLTKSAATIARETLEELIKEVVPLETSDVAVLVGVQVRCVVSYMPLESHRTIIDQLVSGSSNEVHAGMVSRGPQNRDYIYTDTFYSIVNNQSVDHKPVMTRVYDKSLRPDPEES